MQTATSFPAEVRECVQVATLHMEHFLNSNKQRNNTLDIHRNISFGQSPF